MYDIIEMRTFKKGSGNGMVKSSLDLLDRLPVLHT